MARGLGLRPLPTMPVPDLDRRPDGWPGRANIQTVAARVTAITAMPRACQRSWRTVNAPTSRPSAISGTGRPRGEPPARPVAEMRPGPRQAGRNHTGAGSDRYVDSARPTQLAAAKITPESNRKVLARYNSWIGSQKVPGVNGGTADGRPGQGRQAKKHRVGHEHGGEAVLECIRKTAIKVR